MSSGDTARLPWSRLAAEAVVIVLGVLAALAADAWWDGRETRERVATSLASIRAEISENRDRLAEVEPYHRGLADTLRSLRAAGAETISPEVYPHGWLMTPELPAAAWEGARATGTTAELSHRTALMLSDVYEQQAQYLERREAIIPVLYRSMLERGSPDLSDLYWPMMGIISDVASWESALLERYDHILADWPEMSADPGGG